MKDNQFEDEDLKNDSQIPENQENKINEEVKQEEEKKEDKKEEEPKQEEPKPEENSEKEEDIIFYNKLFNLILETKQDELIKKGVF